MTSLLEVIGLNKRFDGLIAVRDVSFTVEPGQITALIGPNGAGKTTLLNMISGVLSPTSGAIILNECHLEGLAPHVVAAHGIARTFQNVELFADMSVIENVMVGRHLHSRSGILAAIARLRPFHAEERRIHENALFQLERIGLAGLAAERAGDLPFGRQRLLEIARALAAEPVLLLLDEAASGLSTREKKKLVDIIFKIRDAGVTIFMVDHDMELVMGISDRVVVLDHGEKIADGTPNDVQNNERVIAAYLGEEPAYVESN